MRLLDIAVLVAGLAASALATGPGSTAFTTIVVPAYTTFCPSPTTWSYRNITYTVTEPTTIIISNCPCTITSAHKPPPVITTTESCPPPPPPLPKNGTLSTTLYPNSTVTTRTGTTNPPPETSLTTTTPATSLAPTKTPVGPSVSPSVVEVNSAQKRGYSIGAILIVPAFFAFTP